MCYSKEVQLTTGSTMLSLSALYYYWYSIKYQATQKKWLLPFLRNIILTFVCVGGHQIFEFLSLVTNNQIIYKIGLVISLSATYFLLRSLEILLNRNLYSKVILLVIGATAIHAFLIEMTFESFSFYVRHNSASIWASAWMFLFIYIHICAIRGHKYLKNEHTKRAMAAYLLATLDISFLISVIYTLWGYFKFSTNACTDSPSIWCTFSVLQMFTLPIFLSAVPKILSAPEQKTSLTIKQVIKYLTVSLLVLIIFLSTLPFSGCLSLKFAFP